MTKGARFLVGIGVGVIALAALASGVEALQDWRSGPPTPCPATVSGAAVTGRTELRPRAAPFAGAAPHRVTFVDVRGDRPQPGSLGAAGRAGAWEAPGDGSGAQLVACRYETGRDRNANIGTCTYYVNGDTTVPVVAVRYRFRVVEAATGREVTAFDVEARRRSCPTLNTVYGDTVADVTAEMDFEDVARPLEALVTAPRRPPARP